ncbi:hypothetical protein GRI72_02960 [Altererythrobacter marinus]|uniref:Uncharacterized protein n=1 Tax=Pelagerythrobacter marinus TaxID=538382 RepID=A0ABW9UUI0_9SPHN|nr:hypothetical protein [Pelagerythrobacter marinus]MXO67793.1 hypothetical protein [Pelagerythrobacter marinus]
MPRFVDDAGNIWEASGPNDPNPVFVSGPQSQMPADPTYQYEGPKAAADARRAEANATVAASTMDAEIRKANAEAAAAQAQANKLIAEQNSGGGLTPGQRKVDEAFATDYADWTAGGGLAGLENKLRVLEEALDTIEGSDTITGPVFGRLPKFIQQMVNPASQDVRADVERAIQETLRQTLGAQFTQKEGEGILARTFDPTQNEESNARRLRNLISELRSSGAAKDSAARYYEQHGTIKGWTAPRGSNIGQEYRNALTMPRAIRTGGPQAAGAGATTTAEPYPPEMVAAHEQLVNRLLQQGGGRLDPQAYARARADLNRQFGYQGDEQGDIAWASRINDYLDQGGSSVPAGITPPERDLSTSEQVRNDIAASPLGAAAIGAADMGGFGGVSALAPAQMQALSEEQPLALTAGQIGGSITGTGLLARGAGALAGKAAPSLLGGGSRAQFGRNVATDAAYGGIYGGITEQDPLATAAFGAGGSVLGQGVGRAAGKAVGGINASQPVQALRARGVPLTVGQSLGGMAKSVEDKATSIPLVGDMINARRLEGLQAFNREAFDEAGKPIGARVDAIGREGTEALYEQAGNAYDSATAGVEVPLDGQYASDFSEIAAMGQRLPDDLRNKLGLALNNRVNPINDAGAMTGDTYQQAIRGLKSYKSENIKPGFEGDYRAALTKAQDALTRQMERGGGESVVRGLDNANAAYRNTKTLEDAVSRAKGGSQSGEIYTFTPSQLQGAVAKTQKKYPGEMALRDLADEGQAVLPSQIPDSGTAGRGAQMLMGGSLVGAGAGAGAGLGGGEGAQTGAIGSALATLALMAGGTRRGQKALTKALLDRPEAMKTAGRIINARRGLFGRATLPLTVSEY